MKAIIIEDNEITQLHIKTLLEDIGFIIEGYASGEEGLKKIKENSPEVVILDINLPIMNGYDVCYFIKKYPEKYGNPKIVMLTERIEIEDVLSGFRVGADEYIKKPFNEEEFIFRVKSVVRRVGSGSRKTLNYKGILIFQENYEVRINKDTLKLTRMEMELLCYFVMNKGVMVYKDKLFETLWGKEYDSKNKTIDVCLTRLRKKIPEFAENLYNYKGIGYKLNA